MTENWIAAIDARSAAALASGDLVPVQTEQAEMNDGGMRFIVRWVSSLAAKDAAAKPAVVPGGPRDPDFNPFLNPDPELTVGTIGDEHVVILNKFPLSAQHLVLARREFEEQLLPLERSDFVALAVFMHEAGGLALCNGGTAGGASQRHKHVQWMPDIPDNPSLRIYLPGLPADLAEQGVAQHAGLKMKHCFVRVNAGQGVAVEEAADSMLAAYQRGCEMLDLKPGADGLLPPYNLLVSDGWLLLLPRSEEFFEDISVSAVFFGGTLYTRHKEQIESIRRAGPLQALAAVGC